MPSKDTLKRIKAKKDDPIAVLGQDDPFTGGSSLNAAAEAGNNLSSSVADPDEDFMSGRDSDNNDGRSVASSTLSYTSSLYESYSELLMLTLGDNTSPVSQKLVEAAFARLSKAVNAEHQEEINELSKRLAGNRESLEKQGNMVTNLTIAHIKGNAFRAFMLAEDGTKANLKWNKLTKRQNISILRDLTVVPAEYPDQEANMVEDLSRKTFHTNVGAEDEDNQEAEDASVDEQEDVALHLGQEDRLCRPHIPDMHKMPGVAEYLDALGLEKLVDGIVTDVTAKELHFVTRNDDAATILRDQGCKWVIYDSLNSTAFRRLHYMVNSLNLLLQGTPSELRMRELLLLQTEKGGYQNSEVRRRADEAARDKVPFMEEYKGDIAAVLQRDPNLNSVQKDALMHALDRSLTLLEGPPGTGKTKTLVGMVKALCKVFHSPNTDEVAAVYGFRLPTYAPLEDWTEDHLVQWVESMALREGVTDKFKVVAKVMFKEQYGGRPASTKKKVIQNGIQYALEDLQEQGLVSEEDLQQPNQFAEILWDRIDKLRRCTSNYANTAFVQCGDREMRIMVSAPTNSAVDNILSQLQADPDFCSKYEIVRMGPNAKAEEALQHFSLESRMNAHVLNQLSEELLDTLNKGQVTEELGTKLETQLHAVGTQKAEEAKNSKLRLLRDNMKKLAEYLLERARTIKGHVSQVARLQDQKQAAKSANFRYFNLLREVCKSLREAARFDIIMHTQVVVGTCTSMGELRQKTEQLKLSNSIVILDEAAQTTEPHALIPLTLGAEWVLMGADLKQLRPTIKTNVAKDMLEYRRCGGSLYGRLVHDLGILEETLTMQYRMNPCIRELASESFYLGRLCEDPACPPNCIIPQPRRFKWPSPSVPIAFFDVNGTEVAGAADDPLLDAVIQEQRSGCSYSNAKEASVVLRLMLLLGEDPTINNITLLTPYAGQEELLNRRLTAATDLLRKLREDGTFFPEEVKVRTVDGYQGQEADVVIFSCVRSSSSGRTLGFVMDPRRVNVAITRAKRSLIIVGNQRSLTSVSESQVNKGNVRSPWPGLIKMLEKRNVIVPEPQVEKQYLSLRVALPAELAVTEQDQRFARVYEEFMQEYSSSEGSMRRRNRSLVRLGDYILSGGNKAKVKGGAKGQK